MTFHILHHLRELQSIWRKQDFNFNSTQKEQYELLLQARRERVLGFYKDGRISKGRAKDADI